MPNDRSKTAAAAFVLAVFVGWLPLQASFEDAPQAKPVDRLNGEYLKNLGRDFTEIVSSPVRWGTGDWLTFAALAGTGAALYAIDNDLYDWIQKNQGSASEDASTVFGRLGNGGILSAFMGALYAGGEIFDEPGLRRTALLSLESFLTTSAIVLGTKAVFGRARPNAGEGARSFHPFSLSTRYTSLPSGDAAGAFAVAATIAEETPGTAVDILAYGLAGLVAVFRVHDRKHWPADVFAGSALGFFVAKKICRLNKPGRGNAYHVAFRLTPSERAVTLSIYF